MKAPERIEAAARSRIRRQDPKIKKAIRCARHGRPLAAEPVVERLVARLQAKAGLSREEALAAAHGLREEAPQDLANRAEKIWGNTIDFVGVSFLERGFKTAQAVARVAYRDGRPQGSGFLITPRLFLTNHHVIETPSQAGDFLIEFDYEIDPADRPRGVTRFELDPSTLFLSDVEDDLDYTLIAVGPRVAGSRDLESFGWCRLSEAIDKHALGECANIVQHPDGRYKEVVLRENRLVSRLDTVLHYVADTEPGSSGSPVFNNEWRVIALHHWGGPWRQQTDDDGNRLPTEINEGIRISAIVAEMRTRLGELSGTARRMLEDALNIPESFQVPTAADIPDGSGKVGPDGTVSWRVPVEISVRIPALMQSKAVATDPTRFPIALPAPPTAIDGEAIKVDPNYSNRPGYDPEFIDGFTIPLPKLTGDLKSLAARNHDAHQDDDPFVLRYQHFSVAINVQRRLAIYTACNIDGKTAKDINRKTGAVTPAKRRTDNEAAEEAEAREAWITDRRINRDEHTDDQLYLKQKVSGFAPGAKGWMDRILQRGHLVRRKDPAWGTNASARKADADTFHFTNAAPQVGFFNMGTANRNMPGTGGGQLWRAIEDYVLDNAVTEKERVCVFSGPVFDKKDPSWRNHVIPGFRVPLRFWKIVVWAEGEDLRALAMIADQGPVLKTLPEAAEEFADTSAVADFVTTVDQIEKLTGLDFGNTVRAADVNTLESESAAGGRTLLVESFDELRNMLRPKVRTSRSRRTAGRTRLIKESTKAKEDIARPSARAGAKGGARRRKPARR